MNAATNAAPMIEARTPLAIASCGQRRPDLVLLLDDQREVEGVVEDVGRFEGLAVGE